ncbi:glycosyltransferase family 4 protein [Nitratifractor sp.]
MRIMHTESMGIRGGQPMRVVEELKIIQELGHTPYLVCRPGTWLEEETKKHGITTLPAPLKRAFDPQSFQLILRYLRRHQIELVHSHNSKDSYSAWAASKIARIPFIRARHSDLVKRPGPIYRWADGIVTTGNKIKRELIHFGISEKKILSLPSYPDSRLFHRRPEAGSSFRQNHRIGKDRLVIGTLTGFKPGKRPHLIFPELVRLVKAFPNILYLIAGPDKHPDYRRKVQEEIAERGLEKHVMYVGYVQASEFLNALDIYLCPSSREGVPQAVMQAMMTALPVVSTNVGGIPDLNPEENLLLAEKDDTATLGRHLHALLSKPEWRRALGQRNRSLAERRFSRDVMKKELELFYEQFV